MLKSKHLSLLMITISILANMAYAEEKIFYPSDINELAKNNGQEHQRCIREDDLKILCAQKELTITAPIILDKNYHEYTNENQMRITDNQYLSNEETLMLQSNWSGSIMFSNQQLEEIKEIKATK